MKTINLSKRQWEWMYWLTGTPQFEEECPEWDQDFLKRLRSCEFKENAIDRRTGKLWKAKLPLTFSFPEDQEVIDFLHEELERLKDMQHDSITGYYQENDKKFWGNIQSINQLMAKIVIKKGETA
jgi:hypothetical protein|tara:strand:+ start:570 stop:944 length:375 start_codon:yes stop_codon:yes gene_type:complete